MTDDKPRFFITKPGKYRERSGKEARVELCYQFAGWSRGVDSCGRNQEWRLNGSLVSDNQNSHSPFDLIDGPLWDGD